MRAFAAAVEGGGAECAQMLMGEGKTTVVCPLLGKAVQVDIRLTLG